MTLPAFKLYPSATNAAVPFCMGHSFKQGDVPAGSSVTAPFADFQCTPKNAWPDGSLKFAILSGRASVTGTTPLVSQLSVGAAATGTPIAASSITAVAVVDCGAFGSATFSGADWASPFMTWISGPKMSSFIYRKPVGSDPHLVAWLEVRAWSGGELEVLPWIENGYLNVAAPTNKSATYTFTLGGTQRMSAVIDLKHHQRTPLISGAALSYWLGADPQLSMAHDKAYMMASELVPSYSVTVPSNGAVVGQLISTYTPLSAGNIVYDGDSMASSGYQNGIGLLPLCDVLYLTATSSDTYASVVRNGFVGGRYNIHYRDETTNRPLKFSSYPNLVIGDSQGFKDNGSGSSTPPLATGGNGPQYDCAHSPNLATMAYLVTGRFYFMEEVQFQATCNYLGNGSNAALRDGSKGLVQTAVDAWQTRSMAWDWRQRTLALSVTPDNDTALRNEFIASVHSNIDFFHAKYVAQANNPFGWVQPGETYDSITSLGAPWQQDFVNAAFGWSMCLGLPIDSTRAAKLNAFFQWKARSTIMRLGPQGSFWYVNGDVYVQRISDTPVPDYQGGTGPWYSTDLQSYTNSITRSETSPWLGSVDGTLYGEIMPGARALWGNILPAMSYAVRHQVPGASAAWARITGASNWQALQNELVVQPLWAVTPSGQTTGVTLPAPTGPSLAVSSGLINGKIAVKGYSGSGLFPPQFATGFAERGRFADDIVGALSTDQFTDDIGTIPAGLTFTPYQDGSFTASGADGAYVVPRTMWKNGVASSSPLTIIIGTPPASTITAVTVSPTSVTQATGTIQFTPVVTGTGSFSGALTRTASAGSISSGNLLTLPAQTSSVQTVTLTWTSVQDGSKSATATVTVPALIVLPPDPQAATRVVIVLQAPPPSNALVANATNVHFAFFEQDSLETLLAPIVKGSTLSTDGSAVLDFDIAGMTGMLTGDKGILALSNEDFTITTLCQVTVQ